MSMVTNSYSKRSPAFASRVNWKRMALSSSPTWRMMRSRASFLQARLKACRGASSRATPSSRPLSRRAQTRSRCLTRTPPALQVRISPNSFVPGARAGGPLRGAVRVLMDVLLWHGKGGRARLCLGAPARFEETQWPSSEGQDALDAGLAGVEGADGVALVADRGQVAG